MNVTAVVGANWGDEGKGRLVDALAAEADLVVRFQGGANAGHTVIDDRGTFVLRLLPSGVLRPGVLNLLGPGTAVDLDVLATELADLTARIGGPPRLAISSRAKLVLPHHRQLDAASEARLQGGQIGSTRCGIAPHYADRYARRGILVDDLFDDHTLQERIGGLLFESNLLLAGYGGAALSASALADGLRRHVPLLAPLVCDSTALLHQALRDGRHILLEGQLGALRDPDHGIYPHVTSSSPLAGFATVGAGLPPGSLKRIIAVTKAYSSAVGAGPFVTELEGPAAEELRRRGGATGEYGAVTGRPRRVGFFDAVATRYGCRLQGATELALTCLDVLGYLPEIPICTAYRLGDERLTDFPTPRRLAGAQPEYEVLPGWGGSIAGARRLGDLPAPARRYIDRIEELVGVEIRTISVGPHRDALVQRSSS